MRYSLAWPDRFFIIICGGKKTKKHGMDMQGYVHGRRLAQCVSYIARALVNHGWSINIAAFSTRDLQEQGHKSYVTRY